MDNPNILGELNGVDNAIRIPMERQGNFPYARPHPVAFQLKNMLSYMTTPIKQQVFVRRTFIGLRH
jgi:hypothetical protein